MPALAVTDLESLYRAHSAWLVTWLSTRAHCRSRASDLAQETFCRLAERPPLQLHAHPRRYLTTVARRLLIDDVRRKTSERCFLEAFALHRGEGFAPSPDQIAQAVEELCLLAELLGELPEKPRQAFLLSRLDGLTYAQIAGELSVSTSMVKQYISRVHAHCYVKMHGCPD
ncbi:sigma-70 family RNA polymerase sigma factor [Altererythrobacter xixiisoli]|uniref:Sigma-70 family RNA polymerase sigma factor n=1 Tax=Croceibacterium xixiisoli TaxID=1476466 RepID=A0A6I4U1C6_9SPHN|nr:sigma-70 family RNA polymerase sigma factor [Croceibacterium xixiisoli]MXP00738.1 sigma-70 family RNA polymerase sigma factor [Croceibacterium xixiisoli]